MEGGAARRLVATIQQQGNWMQTAQRLMVQHMFSEQPWALDCEESSGWPHECTAGGTPEKPNRTQTHSFDLSQVDPAGKASSNVDRPHARKTHTSRVLTCLWSA